MTALFTRSTPRLLPPPRAVRAGLVVLAACLLLAACASRSAQLDAPRDTSFEIAGPSNL